MDVEEERWKRDRLRRLLEAESMKDVKGFGGSWQSGRWKNRKGGKLR